MTSSLTAAPPDEPPDGQPPRIRLVPAYSSSTGDEAVELAALAGLVLDEWQAQTLRDALGERPDGRWSAFEVGVVCGRQNGKNAILEARQLAGLFLLGERLIIHSAHLADTSMMAFRRLEFLIDETPEFARRVKRVHRTNGHEAIELLNGQMIRFRTRTKGGGRGFSGDCVIFDEAMVMPEATLGAILPVVAARPNPQVWYTGSAVDQLIHEHGVVLSRLRARGIRGESARLAYFEWSAEGDNPDELTDAAARDERNWLQANPALGIRITSEYIDLERDSMDPRTFAVERLGVGDWPAPDGSSASVLDRELWDSLADRESVAQDPVCFALDVPPDRAWASICAAGYRSDGLPHLELVKRDRGTGWVVEFLAGLVERHGPVAVVLAASSPAGSLLTELEGVLGELLRPMAEKEHAQACGMIFDRVGAGSLRHLGEPELTAAVRGATKRPLGDAWAWSRKSSAVDISPLVGVTLALWGLASIEPVPARPEPVFAFG